MILFDGGHPLIRCRHCRGVVQVRHGRHHLTECRQYQRKQKLGRMTFERAGKKLHAIAIQRFDGKTWSPEMHYTHASTRAEARRNFLHGEKDHSRIHIVDIGLAIGMFAVDRDGKQLIAD